MSFILGCMGTAVKAALGGFFIVVAIILLSLGIYGFNYMKNYIKERKDEHFTDNR